MSSIHPKVAVPTAVSAVVTVALAVGQVLANSTQFPVLVPVASAVVTVLTALSGYLTPGPAVQVPQVARDVLTLFQQVADALAAGGTVRYGGGGGGGSSGVAPGDAAPAIGRHAAPGAVTLEESVPPADLFPSKTEPAWTPAGVGNPASLRPVETEPDPGPGP